MKPTGYGLLALAALLCVYAAASHLFFDVAPVERIGVDNAGPNPSSGSYWLALIPAAGAAAVGLWMVLTREKGYAKTYDMTRQQAPADA
jgi:hypothetical protein